METRLKVVQVVLLGMFAVRLLCDPLYEIAALPKEFFLPTGMLGPLLVRGKEWLLQSDVLAAFRWILLASITVAMIPRAFPTCGVVAATGILLWQWLVRGFGHSNHAEMPAVLSLLFLAVLSHVRSGTTRDRAATGLVGVFLIFTIPYFLIGVRRLCWGGMDVFATDTIEAYMYSASFTPTCFTFRCAFAVPGSLVLTALMRLGFVAVTVAEIVAPFCLASKGLRLVVGPVLLAFHAGALVFMHILFAEHIVMVPLLLWLTPVLPLADTGSSIASADTPA